MYFRVSLINVPKEIDKLFIVLLLFHHFEKQKSNGNYQFPKNLRHLFDDFFFIYLYERSITYPSTQWIFFIELA